VPDRPPLLSLAIHLGRTKTTTGEQDDIVYLTGRPVEALNAWIAAAKIDSGSVFRGRWCSVHRQVIIRSLMGGLFGCSRQCLATNGFRASAGKHSVQDGDADRSFSLLRTE
jgi:hypothetical protein